MNVISVENVSKKFVLRRSKSSNLADAARGFFRRNMSENFWALRNVCFDVDQGEAVGVIGHNGAGKSTLLKLLTRIMKPNSGRIRTRGRVSALIEVGAGFHPEMTGRENVYLNGSILGMTRREIDSKFDDIVAFAELENFIDTPVKRYSSGMYARLGFSVAGHVNPDILLIDEVLSVGDESFQQKCQQRMSELKQSGVTLLFVSHNLAAVTALCDRALLINGGELSFDGPSAQAVNQYRAIPRKAYYSEQAHEKDRSSDETGAVSIKQVRIVDSAFQQRDWCSVGEKLCVEIDLLVLKPIPAANMIVEIVRSDGVKCSIISSSIDGCAPNLDIGLTRFILTIDSFTLLASRYSISVGILDPDMVAHYDVWSHCAELTVKSDKAERGVVLLEHNWQVETVSAAEKVG